MDRQRRRHAGNVLYTELDDYLWRRKGIRTVKNWAVGCWHGYLSGVRCRLAYVQLMPLPLTVSCFSKIRIGFTFLVPAHLGNPGKGAVKRVCVSQLNTLCSKWQVKITLTCIKRYFPHPHYTVYCCAGHAQRAVNCVIAAVTWSDLWTNHRRSAFFIHFTFRIPHSGVPHFIDSHMVMSNKASSLTRGQ